VAWRIGNDEPATVGTEVAVRDVDRDLLLTLRSQAVEEERQVQAVALRSHLLGVPRQRCKLVLEQVARVVEKTADERALAIVDAAARDEPQ